MADEYDDTSSTVFPLLQSVLASVSRLPTRPFISSSHCNPQYKRLRKVSSGPLDESKRSFLVSLLRVILEKMKWEKDDDPDDMDEDDKAAFEDLRKVSILPATLPAPAQRETDGVGQDLRTFVDAVFVIDQDLVTNAVQTLALQALTAHQNGVQISWQDAELAAYLVYIFGEINKSASPA